MTDGVGTGFRTRVDAEHARLSTGRGFRGPTPRARASLARPTRREAGGAHAVWKLLSACAPPASLRVGGRPRPAARRAVAWKSWLHRVPDPIGGHLCKSASRERIRAIGVRI